MRFSTDLDRAPVVTRFWWVLGHLTLLPVAYGSTACRYPGRSTSPRTGPC